MRTIQSAVVTLDDLKNYVKKKGTEIRERDGSLEVSTRLYLFEFTPHRARFRVKIEAVDDPSDSEERITTEPAKFMAKFLGDLIPGGEYYDKMSSSPDNLARILRYVASGVDGGNIGPRRATRLLRRASIFPNMGLLEKVVTAVCKTAAGEDISEQEIAKLKTEMEKKGWKVTESKADTGLPELKVDVSGIYEASVTIDAIPYKYQFSVIGHPDLDESGDTEDPITQIRKYVKSEPVQEAIQQQNSKELETGETEAAKTHKVPKKPGGLLRSEERTVPPPGKMPSKDVIPIDRHKKFKPKDISPREEQTGPPTSR